MEEGEKFAKEINAVFLETSAKDNLCVNDLFQVINIMKYDAHTQKKYNIEVLMGQVSLRNTCFRT